MATRIMSGLLSAAVLVFSACVAYAATIPIPAPHLETTGEFVPGQVVVRLRLDPGRSVNRNAAETLAGRFGTASVRSLLPEPLAARGRHGGLEGVFVLDYGAGADVRGLAAQIADDPGVVYAEPNYIFHILTTPDDPYYASTGSWGQSYPDMWGLYQVGLHPVGTGSGWDIETGQSNPVVVAVIDTGIDAAHPDIQGRLWVNPGEIPGNGIDDDGNGYIDDVYGWDFVNNDNDPHDGHGHGAHVSGTIAASTNNALGVAGISWGATVMPLKGLSDSGSGPTSGLAEAVIYAADNGAHIINNSWGGLSSFSPQVLEDAFAYAASAGCLSIAAVGNDGTDLFALYPARYPEVMAVAATDWNDQPAWFTTYGSAVKVTAPGVDILSLRSAGTDMYGDGIRIVGGEYYRASGTSMACPHVAGVAALIWSAHPHWTAEEVRAHLRRTTDSIDRVGSLYVGALGSGRLNAYRALAFSTPQPLIRIEQVTVSDAGAAYPNGQADPGETVDLVVTVGNTWLSASSVTATLSTADAHVSVVNATASYGPVGEWETNANEGDPFTVSVGAGCPFGHVATLTIDIDADGHLFQESITLTVATPQLAARGYLVRDVGGNSDTSLEPGKSYDLVVRVGNAPYGAPLANVTATLTSLDPHVTVEKGTANYPDVAADEVTANGNDPFQITLGPNFPADHVATLALAVSADGWSETLDVELVLPAIHREISDYVNIPMPYGPPNPSALNVAIDARDRIHATWEHPDEVLMGYVVAHREWDSQQWLARQYVAGRGGQVSAGNPRLAVDSAGRPHVTWNEVIVVDAHIFPLPARGVYHRHRPGDWNSVTNISKRPESVNNDMAHGIVVDREDNIHVAWRFTDWDTNTQSFYHSRRVDGVWEPEEAIMVNTTVQTYYDWVLLPTADGGLWVLYRKYASDYPILYRVWDGSNWSAEAQVPTGGQQSSTFSAGSDSQGRVHVLMRNNQSPARLYYIKHEAGGWSSPVQVPDVAGTINVYHPRVHVDREDRLHLLWVVRTRPATSNVDQIYTWRQGGVGNWLDPEPLTSFPPSPGKALLDLRMVVDSDWRRHVFYIASGEGVFHSLVGSVAPPAPGDFDGDGDVDLDDFAVLQNCLGVPDPSQHPTCGSADLDNSGSITTHDVTLFRGCVTGAGIPSDEDCLP